MNHHHDLLITYRAPTDIRCNPRNARTHSKRQVDQIAKSISTFGFTNPVLVDEESTLIAGHGHIAAAKKLGIDKIPVIALCGLSETERRALLLADNKIALNAGWDTEQLRVELTALAERAHKASAHT